MRIIKRNGSEAEFDARKISGAIRKASDTGEANEKLTEEEIKTIAEGVTKECEGFSGTVTVEEVQDLVEDALIAAGHTALAKRYIKYRYTRQLARRANTTDDAVMALIDGCNEEARQENSNKDVTVASVQRDYMAGYLSRDLTERVLLPADIVEAHREGIIHFHDTDYYAQRMYNCCLVNLEDMLQNGTVISGTKIDPPKSFATACTVASQVVSQVASNQFGGQTFTLAHLAPFVDVSRQKIRKRLKNEFDSEGLFISEEQLSAIAEKEVVKEIEAGMQTIQYQLVTLMTTNGQAPFVTTFMYIDEVPEGQTRDDLALMIKVMLEQRMLGVKNEQGVYITPAFPKLIYVLDEDNMYEGTPYYYLTVLAAKCTAKRMVPDYISAKIMKDYKKDIYPCMGCRSFLTSDRFTDAGIGNIENRGNYRPGEHRYYGRSAA